MSSGVRVHDDQRMEADVSGVKSVAGAQTLERGLDLLECAARNPMTLQDLIRRTGMNRGVVYRLVSALTARGYLVHDGDGQLRGGRTLLQLGLSTAGYTDMVTVAGPHLNALAIETGLSAFLARREGDFSLHLMRSPGVERIAVTTQPGTRRLLPETGLGRALMCDESPETWIRLLQLVDNRYHQADWQVQNKQHRDTGVLFQFGSSPDLINSVCAVVRNATGVVIGAVNVAAAAQYLGEARMIEVQPFVAETARVISFAMGADLALQSTT